MRPKINPFANLNVPLVGQPKPDYAVGIPIFLPDDPNIVALITDSVAMQEAKKGKGDIVVIYGEPPKMIRCFQYEEFLTLVFGKEPTLAEAATGGTATPDDAPLVLPE
jgi:hypothetical protein